MREAGIEPLITLDHFVYPGWVQDQGGWTNPQTASDFVAYVRRVAGRYHEQVRWWLTFNEAAFFLAIDIATTRPGWSGAAKIRRNVISAHRQSYDAIHAIDADARVSSNIVWLGDTPGSRMLQAFTDWAFLDQIDDKIDYLPLDYYSSDMIHGIRTGHHWQWYPDPPGLYRALRMLSDRYPKLPLMIAEIGMATENGKPREDGVRREVALRDTVYWTQRAHAEGINVIGYMVWTLTDNFEWGSYTPRFGLYTVDALGDPDLVRIPTAAVPAYRSITAGNGVPMDYVPVMGIWEK